MQYTRLATKVLFPHEQALSTVIKKIQDTDKRIQVKSVLNRVLIVFLIINP